MTQSGELFQSLNSNGKNLQVNTQVITLTDNLSHPYFSIINLSKNNVKVSMIGYTSPLR